MLLHNDLQSGKKPIHFASDRGHVDVLNVLIKLGSDPRSPTQDDVRMKDYHYLSISIIILSHTYVYYSSEDNPFIVPVLMVMCHW